MLGISKGLDLFHRPIFISINKLLNPKGTTKYKVILLILGLLLCGGLLVYITGGLKYFYSHFMYLPIIIASFAFRVPGSIITSIAAGLILGPFMPLEVQNNIPQSTVSWLYRMMFFILVGTTTSVLASLLSFQLSSLTELVDKVSINYAKTLKTFAHSVELRDQYTGEHCERVAHNALVLGKELDLSKNDLETLYWAGLLHDLGKIAVPEHILLKADKLTSEEYEIIKLHPEVGSDILMSLSNDFKEIAAGVCSHHERWDGTGYPYGLKEDSIPVFGRILAVVDVFEALTSNRPYRKSLSPQRALQYLKDKSVQFDPSILNMFCKLYETGKIKVQTENELKSFNDDYDTFHKANILTIPLARSPFSKKTTRIIMNIWDNSSSNIAN